MPAADVEESRKALHLYQHIKEFQQCIGVTHTINKRMFVLRTQELGIKLD
jgi:hypothetical protein